VNEFTLTFLFDHDFHPKGYVHEKEKHYGYRQRFARALELYHADTRHRY
ncbi:MAG: hypothetical protein JWO82_2846, partial [Akkermansiaceae bacterium]|nr:hypothetical protein [Akkermansiaceae bacterium]